MKTEEELCDFLGKDLNKIEKLCRICLSDDLSNAVLIYKDSEEHIDDIEKLEAKLNMDKELTMQEKVAVFGRVKLKFKDDLSKYICEQCCYEVDVAYTFRIKCHKAESLLKRVLETLKIGKQNLWETSEDKKEFIDLPIMVDSRDIGELNIKREDIKSNSEDILQSFNEYLSDNDAGKLEEESGKEDDEKISKQIDKINEKRYICDFCDKNFSTKGSIKRHITIYHNEHKTDDVPIPDLKDVKVTGSGSDLRYHCPECSYKCRRRHVLGYHMVIHTGLKPFTCDQCSKSFAQSVGLINHKKTHGDKSFTCHECGKQFITKYRLKCHQKVHDTDFNFVCHLCDKRLKTQKSLNTHLKRHSQNKNYSCEVCGMLFYTRNEVFNHSKIHYQKDMFKCSQCSYSTHCKYALKHHIQKHSGQRPHKCDQCDYSAYKVAELRVHQRRHTKERRYHCPVCQVKFSQSTSVNAHMLQKHGKKFTWKEYKSSKRIIEQN